MGWNIRIKEDGPRIPYDDYTRDPNSPLLLKLKLAAYSTSFVVLFNKSGVWKDYRRDCDTISPIQPNEIFVGRMDIDWPLWSATISNHSVHTGLVLIVVVRNALHFHSTRYEGTWLRSSVASDTYFASTIYAIRTPKWPVMILALL